MIAKIRAWCVVNLYHHKRKKERKLTALTFTFRTWIFVCSATSVPHACNRSRIRRAGLEFPMTIDTRRTEPSSLCPSRKYPRWRDPSWHRRCCSRPSLRTPPRLLGSSSSAVGICLLSSRRHTRYVLSPTKNSSLVLRLARNKSFREGARVFFLGVEQPISTCVRIRIRAGCEDWEEEEARRTNLGGEGGGAERKGGLKLLARRRRFVVALGFFPLG